MSTRTQSRPIPLVLTALIALFSALVALAFAGGHDAMAHNDANHASTAASTPKEVALRQDMRKLWEDHITWTRLAVISLTTNSPDTQATVARLLRNQADIGNAVKPFYGRAAGDELTRLLREHILIAADLIAAAKTGNQEAVSSQQARWRANADEIASFLSSANPRSWKPAEMRAMMRSHLRLTTDEVVARLTKNWAADVRAYDRIHVQILRMADMLSDGLVAQFPARLR
jgi:hypothetical protein